MRQITLFSIPLAFVKVLDMMVGEIEYRSIWLENIQKGIIKMPRSVISLIMIIVFIFMMPVVIMNLMVYYIRNSS